jgi:hypothetical protein
MRFSILKFELDNQKFLFFTYDIQLLSVCNRVELSKPEFVGEGCMIHIFKVAGQSTTINDSSIMFTH